MAKRLFSSDKRSEAILSHCRENNENISQLISNAVVDETLPVYSQLRVEALYLLDLVIDGAKDWTGNKLIIATGEDEIQNHTRFALGRGITWLKRNHHIKNGNVLRDVINHFNTGPWTGGTMMDDLNDYVKENMETVRKKLEEIDPNYNDFGIGLGALARDVLDHWDTLWDWDNAYNLLESAVYCEAPLESIDPFLAIRLLQVMENTFIMEAIGEKI